MRMLCSNANPPPTRSTADTVYRLLFMREAQSKFCWEDAHNHVALHLVLEVPREKHSISIKHAGKRRNKRDSRFFCQHHRVIKCSSRLAHIRANGPRSTRALGRLGRGLRFPAEASSFVCGSVSRIP